jgi:hypothetical protein
MSKATNISNFHMQYLDVTSQHWHPGSERFAGGDHLLTAVENGWEIDQCLLVTHWYAGMRGVKVYNFSLKRGDQQMIMPVIDNPYIQRLIKEGVVSVIVKEEVSN